MKNTGVITLHGRDYKTVALRVAEFREKFGLSEGWGIRTVLVRNDEAGVLFRAEVLNPDGKIVATGHAEEARTKRGINATSALENCEPSAIGRALSAAGFGGSEYASADELAGKLAQQGATHEPLDNAPRSMQAQADEGRKAQHHVSWTPHHQRWYMARLSELGVSYEDVANWCRERGKSTPSCWSMEHRNLLLAQLGDGQFKDIPRKQNSFPSIKR